jgi:hypothetical protein
VAVHAGTFMYNQNRATNRPAAIAAAPFPAKFVAAAALELDELRPVAVPVAAPVAVAEAVPEGAEADDEEPVSEP